MSDAFSLCTVISPDEITSARVIVEDTVMYDLQDGLKIVVHHQSLSRVDIKRCQFELTQVDEQLPSHAFSLTGGEANVSLLIVSTSSVY